MQREMTGRSVVVGLLTLAFVGAPSSARAQQPLPESQLPAPRIFVMSPPGGKAGATVEVTFTGADIEEPESLFFSTPGIKAEPMVPPAPPPDPKQPAKPRRGGPAVKLAFSKFKVTIPASTPVGVHDVRLICKWGITNPRAFVVGNLNEAMEKEPNNDVPEAQRVELNTTVNGAISAPTDVDYSVFAGKKGQRVVVSCLASSVDSRLNAGIELFDASGRRLAANRHYHRQDALLDCTLPADGDYYLRVFEFTHQQGDAEHFYRLSISTAPWIDAVVPPMVEPGKTAQVTLYGRNLPGGKLDPTAVLDGNTLETLAVTVDVPRDPAAGHHLQFSGLITPAAAELDGFEYRIRGANGVSNPYLLTYARAPVVLDNGANDTAATAQAVTLPCEIAGRVEKRHDRDWYAFTAKKGDVYGIEVFSDRLSAPTDMMLSLQNAGTKQLLAELDDDAEMPYPNKFFTRTSDPARFRFEAREDGNYLLLVRSQDADVRAGPRHVYRVSITPERPDFRLIVMPPADHRPEVCRVSKGGEHAFSVLAHRIDGCAEPIELTVEGLPAGVSCAPQTLGAQVRYARLVVSAAPAAAVGTYEIKVKGKAQINGQTVTREARSASVSWPVPPQNNFPTLSRLDRNVFLAVNDSAPFHLSAALEKPFVFQGDKANVNFKVNRLWPDFKTPMQVLLADPPRAGNQPVMTMAPVALNPGKDEMKGVLDVRSNTAPGTYSLAFFGTTQLPYNKDPMAKQKPNINVVLPSTPITFLVAPKQLASVKLSTATLQTQAGREGEVVVQVARQHNFSGPFKVQLVLPANFKGIEAAETTIPAGQNEVKLTVKVAADAPVGNHGNLVVRATALYEGKVPISQETKFGVNVAKK